LKNRMNNIATPVVLVAACLSFLGGCASTPTPPAPKPYQISADADPIMNRDISGKPLSVVVRLYQLKDEKEFDQLTFDLATSNRTDAELFGESLLQRSELLLVPGTTHISTETLLPETKYLGVVAYFRKPDAHYWRYLIDAQQVREKGLSFHALDCYLQLKDIKSTPIPGQAVDAKPACLDENIATPSTAPTINTATTAPAKTTSEKPKAPPRKRKYSHPANTVKPGTVNTQPTLHVGKPVTPLPAPPVPTSASPAVTAPTININVTPTLGLPKWGAQ
jgi:type VI secretion system protein VasD